MACRTCSSVAILCVILLAATTHADTIHVPGDYPAIQDAINAAQNGDEIVVAPGIYPEVINFNGKAITLRSSDGADVTIIDGAGLNDSVVKCISGEGLDSVLDGFTITGGLSFLGGGMFNANSSPTVANCIFTANLVTGTGAGMYNAAGTSPMIVRCRFSENVADMSGGGMGNGGDASPTILHSYFVNNVAADHGGGIFTSSNNSPTIINCIFSGNEATNRGGGIVTFDTAHATVIGCSFGENSAAEGGGISNLDNASSTMINSIFWANTPDQLTGNATTTYSMVQGGWPGEGNIDVDPLFIDPDNADYRLDTCSPATDAGNNDAVPVEIITDLDGNPRFVDDAGKNDTGNGTPPIVDMGAFERQEDTVLTTYVVTAGESIQAAIDKATGSGCEEIVVEPGLYNEVIDFLGKAITLRSSEGAEVTTIDGLGFDESVVKCVSGEESDTVLDGFTITNGSAFSGGGLRNDNGSPTVRNCVFVNNAAISGGGAIANVSPPNSNPTVVNCKFINNVANGGDGGAIDNSWGLTTQIINCLFQGNIAGAQGGGVHGGSGLATVINSTFVDNHIPADRSGGGLSGPFVAVNCIFWDNFPDHVEGGGGPVTYSNVQGGWPGEGNIDDDPLFIDPDNGDLHLAFDSPCIDVGDNSVVEENAVDMDGEARIQHGIVDMGADEFSFCVADINGDGIVNAADLAQLLGAWGPCPEPPADCPADIHGEGDGIVQADDLATLLGAWGPCE